MASKQTTYRDTLAVYGTAVLAFKKELFLSFINPLGALALNVGIPLFAGAALASIALDDDKFMFNMLLLGVAVSLGILSNFIGFQALMRLQANTMSYLAEKTYSRLLQRGVGYHINRVGGKLVSDANDFVNAAGDIMLTVLAPGSSLVVTIVIGLIVLFVQSWQLALFVSLIVAIVLTMAFIDAKKRSELRARRLKATKEAISHYADTIVNAVTVKTFGAETRELKRYVHLNDNLRDLRVHDWQAAGRSGNYRLAFLVISIFALLLFLNYSVDKGYTNVGTGVFAFTYTFSLLLRLFEINILTRRIEEAFLHAKPMTEMLQEKIEVVEAQNAKKLEVPKGSITFENVTFAYSDAKSNLIFKNLHIDIDPGERVGFVGTSGGGKTTLTKLLLRHEDVNRGSILIDNQDIRDITQSSLHTAIGYVPQEPLLFHRSLKENISYGKPHATEEEIVKAAKLAGAHTFITELPSGYDTIVGERGIKLSGGQRQRVAIARVILKDAPILVLDEATSALDSESEILVQNALDKLMSNRTTIAIAHRLSTIQKMDRIIVLDNGKIVEEGSHSELLQKKGGHYARLWKHQSGGFLQED